MPGRALDELSCAGTNTVSGFGALSSETGNLSAIDGGLEPCDFSALKGGDVAENIQLLSLLLNGGDVPAGLRDTVLLNAGAALWIAGRASDLKEGVKQARDLIEAGTVQNWLERVRAFYA
jgi:anthranilate phosphoribosyltransferase